MPRVAVSLLAATTILASGAFLVQSESPQTSAGPFSTPTEIQPGVFGYEPSIRVGEDGRLYVTAHKQDATDGTRLASWLWHSGDDGASWSPFQSPLGLHEELLALEGELALDAAGRIYFVDTYMADQTFSVWRAGAQGPAWEQTRPVQGTLSVDDRPWMDAHGDGIVYLLSNHGPDVPSHHSILSDDPTAGDRIWLHVSEDRGATWESRAAFSGAWWCGIAASKVDDRTLYAGCFTPSWLQSNLRMNYLGQNVTFTARVYKSDDRGRTWTENTLQDYETRNGPLYPKPATDRAGHAYHVWIDDNSTDARPAIVHVAREATDDTWEILDVTPMTGTIQRIWADGGQDGTLALSFYATPDVPPRANSRWNAYALLTHEAQALTPTWTLTKVSDRDVAIGDDSPRDFFQIAIGPDDRAHIVYEHKTAEGSTIFHTAQTP